MNKKRIPWTTKKLRQTTVIMSLSAMMFAGVVVPSYAHSADDGLKNNNEKVEALEISVRADLTQWRYQIIGGKLHKRLYNLTTQQWIGGWILVE